MFNMFFLNISSHDQKPDLDVLFVFFQTICDQVLQASFNCHVFIFALFSQQQVLAFCYEKFTIFQAWRTGSLPRNRVRHTFILCTNITWDRTSKLYFFKWWYILISKISDTWFVFMINRIAKENYEPMGSWTYTKYNLIKLQLWQKEQGF